MVTEELPLATVAEWLRSLVSKAGPLDLAIEASKAAIQTAALIPEAVRRGKSLGQIVFTTSITWDEPDPESVFLGGGLGDFPATMVHPRLENDEETLKALQALGIVPTSAETALKILAGRVLVNGRYRGTPPSDWHWRNFWNLVHDVGDDVAYEIIKGHEHWRSSIRVRVVAGTWSLLHHSLLPGPIVPEDGSRDAGVAIDTCYHEAELSLLRQLGAVDTATGGCELSPAQMGRFLRKCRITFTDFAQREVRRTPRDYMLNFEPPATTSGPLDVLESLSDDGKAEYTWRLLSLHHTFTRWTMRHDTQEIYPPISFNSPALEILQEHGRISTDEGIRPFSGALGDSPQDPAVFHKLLTHPQADLIRRAFDLPDDEDIPVEPLGEDIPIPLLDEWPGLKPHLSAQRSNLELVRCDGFRTFGGDEPKCVVRGSVVYVARQYEEEHELGSVLDELGVRLRDDEIRRVLLAARLRID